MSIEAAALPAVLLSGGPGVGKSTVGRVLARRLGGALIDQDTVTEPLVAVVAGLVGVHDLDDPRLADATRAARYETIVAAAEDNLRVGAPVVLVAPFTRERRDAEAWGALDRRLRAAGGVPLLVWLHLDPATAALRLAARGAARDLAKDPSTRTPALDVSEPAVPHLPVAGESLAEHVVDTIVAALAEVPPG